MITKLPTAKSLRVAVLGSGIAGSTAARKLADRGLEVTVFEAGFGIGGRTSTRQTRDEFRYQFDHGAQYIGSPKTNEFRGTLREWKSNGWVSEWTGRFLTADAHRVVEEEAKERYVGQPGMHSICRNLLRHDNIEVRLQTRANASRDEKEGCWQLIHGRTNENLGTFDWLIASDRLSGSHYRKDLASAGEDVKKLFRSSICKIKSVKSLTAMVVFESPLKINIDGVQFTGNDPKYGSLGWAARDTSKPGRQRLDEKECWVLQSNPNAATAILKGKKFTTKQIREKAKDVLVQDFLNCVPFLAGDEDINLPPVATAIGHRWGAAFPVPSEDFTQMESQQISSKNFIACGDYFGKFPGRIEGAYLSGVSAANQLVEIVGDKS